MKILYGLLCLFLCTGCAQDAASVGVIGGTDGPTAILVSSTVGGLLPMQWLGVGCLIAAAISFYLHKRKK